MKAVRSILFIFILIFIVLSLSACGKSAEGVWKLTGGNAVSAIYSLEGDGTLESSDAEVIFRLEPDGVLTIEMSRAGITETASGTWEESGDTLTLAAGSQPLKCSYAIEDNVLTMFFKYQGQNATFIFNKI